MSETKRIFLSPPCVDSAEREAVMGAFDSGYVAPCGPMVDELERRLAALAGRRHAVALSAGTAAIDLAMAEWGVDSEWTVFVPTLTFVATIGPAWHRGARLVFVDSDETGNIDTDLLAKALEADRGEGRRLVVGVDLYGRPCNYGRIAELCRASGAVFLCDSAEAVGAKRGSVPAGGAGDAAIFSFNGNKIVTTSGGGALLTDDEGVAERARKRSQQSRERAVWYEHREIGYNYRMSNILASVGISQLGKLDSFIARRSEIKSFYMRELAGRFEFLPPVEGENHWLTVALAESSKERDSALARLAEANIEARPVWKPMHLQPVFAPHFAGDRPRCRTVGGAVSESLFERGICLPSGSGMSNADLVRVVSALCR
ncbi:MAG: aminotransferase class I/II-fold pyridoxal phosphate-dependent enzyme [Lentisphaerae bacterium]|nr:aminotransferase class I/II-fold pyridoxal phosphate-dependent enzyme [Lentisphaerota bacterium]